MHSSLYKSVSTRQPCMPSSSRGSAALAQQAAPLVRSVHGHSSSRRWYHCSPKHIQEFGHQHQPSRGPRAVRAVQQQHDMFNDQPMRQHQQHIPAPEWHPRLFGIKESKRAALEHAARLYYEEVWNAGSLDLLEELADAGVCFNDALGMEADVFSRSSLKAVIQDFQGSHPLLKYELEDVLVDEQRDTVVVHYTVTAAHLLPQLDGSEATGHVSVVTGMDKLHFTASGLISSILSFRQRFMEEEAEPINWDAV